MPGDPQLGQICVLHASSPYAEKVELRPQLQRISWLNFKLGDSSTFGSKVSSSRQTTSWLQELFFAALTFAHRARCAAAILFRAEADSVRFLDIEMALRLLLFALTFAQRAFSAAEILALPAADILPRFPLPFAYVVPKAESAAAIALTSLVNRACSFLNVLTTPFRLIIKSPSRGIVTGRAA